MLINYDLRNQGKNEILFAEVKKVHLATQDDQKHVTGSALVLSLVGILYRIFSDSLNDTEQRYCCH